MASTDTEAQHASVTQAFSSPDKDLRTRSKTMSRPSSRRRVSSPGPASSPSQIPRRDFSPNGHDNVDVVNDESISPLDPRRFTPTLHASLVSEILSLRREVESKSKVIDAFESSIEDSRAEINSLNESLMNSTRENRSLKRQIQLLEGGTFTALNDLTKERDEAMENITDVRKRLEQTQRRVRTQEEEVERAQMLWDRDKQAWEAERRNWERKVHVLENRLKRVIDEVAATQVSGPYRKLPEGDPDESLRDSAAARGSDSTSVRSSSVFGKRRTSMTSVSSHDEEPQNGRFSVMSLTNGLPLKAGGLNLADELALDEEEEEAFDERTTGEDVNPVSPVELPEERPTSVQSQASYGSGMKARRILGLSYDSGVDRPHTPDTLEPAGKVESNKAAPANEKTPTIYHVDYCDAGVQYSPPPSPQLPPQSHQDLDVRASSLAPDGLTNQDDGDRETAASSTKGGYQTRDSSTATIPVEMVSTSCQAVDNLPSPPWTPKGIESATQSTLGHEIAQMTSTATQTYEVAAISKQDNNATVPVPQNELAQLQILIPTIAIHPPGSEPPSPRNSVVLPPHTKTVSCQTDFISIANVKSVSIQTEEIRIDQRPVKLPASLLPSAIPNRLPISDDQEIAIPFQGPPPRSPRRGLFKPGEGQLMTLKDKQPERQQSYPGNNDNGPLAEDVNSDIRRPFRSSSLFAGFENMSDDEGPGADIFSDEELFNRPMACYTLKSGKLVSKRERPSLDDDPLREADRFNSETEVPGSSIPSEVSPPSNARNGIGPSKRPIRKMASSSKQPDIRRTAMISNGAAAHQKARPRSPSEPSIDSALSSHASRPPFPVPARLSSKKVPVGGGEVAQSPTPYSNGKTPERRGRRIARQPTVRKVRSAATLSKANQPERPRSRSPPTMSTSPLAPDSPQLPPMPVDDVTAPRSKRSVKKMPSSRAPSSHTYMHMREESFTPSIQPTSVVDAIAQTMVGEWMYKYVRRRRSFGVSESKESWELGKSTDEMSANITSSGVRHKRWVWLAPYERAVMWSSKQPTSGSALLGKSGRKLTIQSVLDVKDDTPLPKGASPQGLFNRSILILTPQRALKFTALSLERHYIWLTALSFLSHSTLGITDLASLPPVPQEGFVSPPSTASLRRNPIRDSIRVAKGKPRPKLNDNRSFTPQTVAVPELSGIGIDLIDPIMDAADPPNVPRFSSHSRKRSNTAPRVPPSAFRSFSSHTTMPSTYSATTAGSEIHTPTSVVAAGFGSGRSSFSRRTSEASGAPSVSTGNFFDAVGTVRMEAFIDRTHMSRHRGGYRSRQGLRKRDSTHWGLGHHEMDFTRPEDGSEVFYRTEDPFRGF